MLRNLKTKYLIENKAKVASYGINTSVQWIPAGIIASVPTMIGTFVDPPIKHFVDRFKYRSLRIFVLICFAFVDFA